MKTKQQQDALIEARQDAMSSANEQIREAKGAMHKAKIVLHNAKTPEGKKQASERYTAAAKRFNQAKAYRDSLAKRAKTSASAEAPARREQMAAVARTLLAAADRLEASARLKAARPASDLEEQLGLEPGEAYGADEQVPSELGTVRVGGYSVELSQNQESGRVTAWVKGLGDIAFGDTKDETVDLVKDGLKVMLGTKHVTIRSVGGNYVIVPPQGLPRGFLGGQISKKYRGADDAQDAAQLYFPNATVDIS